MQNSLAIFTFLVLTGITLLGKFVPKKCRCQNCHFKLKFGAYTILKFGSYTNSTMQKAMVIFDFSVFGQKYPVGNVSRRQKKLTMFKIPYLLNKSLYTMFIDSNLIPNSL